jgi:hypothetical protein
MMTPEQRTRYEEFKRKAIDNTITVDELKTAVILMRESRLNAQAANASSGKSKAKKTVKSADDLLNELEGL